MGRFFVVSAPSGTGKTTLVKKILESFPDMERSISCTTRPPRAGEREGVDYQFIDERTFRHMAEKDQFFEWEEVHGDFYGTPRAPLLKRREMGLDTVLDIDTRGALNLKRVFPESCLIFLVPPSMEVLEARLRSRQTEGENALKRRLEDAKREMGEREKFDYVVLNDTLERSLKEIRELILRERKKVSG